ncbi:hypothetical protein [Chryseobacterium luquanense]|uniref:Uncharacterized protein n=1 Tax=Chryseobacterium luquanense TaxID=2983766 RepID=A0ABT3Y538_9FLAO|nr:hypothetical protein [Chryseobacterium luquanense]MCX8533191.1 hypothetical protein [Chryseobacterium luquanense]
MENNNNFPINISLQLSFERKFYRYSYNEYTIINGKTHRSELNKILHVTLQAIENGRFEFHIETFNREHRDKELSLSEKDFLAYVARINDEIKVVTDEYAKLKILKDLPVLQEKSKEITKKLSGSYVGRHAENSFKFLNAFYNNGNMVCDDLLKNNQFGLILHKFYGKYNKENNQNHIVRYRNLMNNTVMDIEEQAQLQSIDEKEQLITLSYTGKLSSDKNWEQFYEEMERKQISYNKEKDVPTLNKYEGFILFDSKTKEVLEHNLTLVFSLGENYQKKFIYELKEISYEEA